MTLQSKMMYIFLVLLCFFTVTLSQNNCPGLQPHELIVVTNPASSCSEIAQRRPQLSSGMYWLILPTSEQAVHVYCDLEREFPTGTKGWVRVANLNMTDPNQQCPQNFNLYTQPKRLCGISRNDKGCDSVKFTSYDLQYNIVCGRVVGYQFGSPDAFRRFVQSDSAIDKDGVSITHGNPRKHIWTYAAGPLETTNQAGFQCPCSSPAGAQPPSLVTTTVSQVCTAAHLLLLCTQMMYFGMERGVKQMRLHAATLQTSLGSVRSFLNQPLMTWRCASAMMKDKQMKMFQLK